MSRLSGSHFAALFKSRTGYPALQYQTQLRKARAIEVLDATDQSIAAAATGCLESFYFARQFERIHEATQRAYRGKLKGEWFSRLSWLQLRLEVVAVLVSVTVLLPL